MTAANYNISIQYNKVELKGALSRLNGLKSSANSLFAIRVNLLDP